MDKFIDKLGDVNKEIVSAIDQLPNINSVNTKLGTLYDAAVDDIDSYYTKNKDDTVKNPDPNQPALTPDFVKVSLQVGALLRQYFWSLNKGKGIVIYIL